MAGGISIFLTIVALFGAAGIGLRALQHSGGAGGIHPGGSAGGHSAVRTVAASRAAQPTPTDAPEQPERRAPHGIPEDAVLARVAAIRTGDSLEITVDGRVYITRLAGIDAPEPTTASPAECYGDEAKTELEDLLPAGSPIWVSPDPARLPANATFDGYAWTEIAVGTDPRLVNEELVRGGYARFRPPAPDTGYDEPARLSEAETDAAGAHRGLWGACT